GGGTVSPASGKYEAGTKLTLKATPNNIWQFDNWSGDIEGTNPDTTIIVSEPINIQAHFSKKNYQLTINIQGKGTVDQKVISTLSAAGYNPGTVVQLTAKP